MATNPKSRDHDIGRFTPPSLKDFSIRAKNLSNLLGTPLQKTQGQLARLYGYSGVHEIQESISKAERDPSLAGPFNRDLYGYTIGQRSTGANWASRGNKTLEVAGKLLGISQGEWTKEVWDSREIGLFDEPVEHRIKADRILGKRAMIKAINDDPCLQEHQVSDYAFLGETSFGEVAAYFTQLGQQVHDAIEEANGENPDLEQLERIADAHPNNPWAQLAVVSAQAWENGQHPWMTYAPSNLAPNDDSHATLDMMILAKGRSTPMLKLARRATDLFKALYKGTSRDTFPSPKTIGIDARHGADVAGYAHALYLEALIRSNGAHGVKTTENAFKKAIKVNPRHDLQEGLMMHYVGEGNYSAAVEIADKTGADALIDNMARTYKAIEDGNNKDISRHLARSLMTNPWIIDALEYDRVGIGHDPWNASAEQILNPKPSASGQPWGGNSGAKCAMPHARRLAIDEFLWRGGKTGKVPDKLRLILSDDELRKAYARFWKAITACFGSITKDAATARNLDAERDEARKALIIAVEMTVLKQRKAG